MRGDYRAKNAFGDWVYGFYYEKKIYVDKDEVGAFISELTPKGKPSIDHYVDPATVGIQFKNNKLSFFEGDTVLVKGSKRVGEYETEVVIGGNGGCYLKENKTLLVDDRAFIAIVKVTGNIHDA